MRRIFGWAILWSTLWPLNVDAGGSSVQYPGLVLTGAPEVAVSAVDLDLGVSRAVARYTLVNRTAAPAAVDVEFRMFEYYRFQSVSTEQVAYMGVTVEHGVVRPVRIVRAAVGEGAEAHDVTSLLQGCGVSIDDFGGTRRDALVSPVGALLKDASNWQALSGSCRKLLKESGAIDLETAEGPQWGVTVSYRWRQEVAPAKPTTVRLEFVPVMEDLDYRGAVTQAMSRKHEKASAKTCALPSWVGGGWLFSMVPVALRPGEVSKGSLRVTASGSDGCVPLVACDPAASKKEGQRVIIQRTGTSLGEPVAIIMGCST